MDVPGSSQVSPSLVWGRIKGTAKRLRPCAKSSNCAFEEWWLQPSHAPGLDALHLPSHILSEDSTGRLSEWRDKLTFVTFLNRKTSRGRFRSLFVDFLPLNNSLLSQHLSGPVPEDSLRRRGLVRTVRLDHSSHNLEYPLTISCLHRVCSCPTVPVLYVPRRQARKLKLSVPRGGGVDSYFISQLASPRLVFTGPFLSSFPA